MRDLTSEEKLKYGETEYVKYESYPEDESPVFGRFWTQEQLDDKGCGGLTKMSLDIAETYARHPGFYGSTYCVHCHMHKAVEEFKWEDGEVVGS